MTDELALHALCPCGHEVSWHSAEHGCRFRGTDNNRSKDGSGYCTCPAIRADFEEEAP